MKQLHCMNLLVISILTLGITSMGYAGSDPQGKLQPILPVKDIRVGMKGYGLTVFHGVKIEPFHIEVVSIEPTFEPKRSVIWIRCTDPLLQKTGPVSGMSGSPIYLWPKGSKQEFGKGGLLIGAFAYGFGGGKDCYAGVQPIELMRAVAQRAKNPPEKDQSLAARAAAEPAEAPGKQIRQLLQVADKYGIDENHLWRARALADVLDPKETDDKNLTIKRSQANTVTAPFPGAGQLRPMMLPVNVGSAQLSAMLSPVFKPMGLMAVRTPNGTPTGKSPPGYDLTKLKLQSGSMLTIPMAHGDLDLSASGTVTEVLPDGRVLAFGHAMFGQGPSALPIATGYVHFTQPGVMSSFKFSGSAQIAGALIRDENSAIVAVPNGEFYSAPVRVTVKYPGGKEKVYNYQVAHHPSLTPSILGTVAMSSITADRSLPRVNTLRIRGDMTFDGDRKYEFKKIMANGSGMAVMFSVAPIVSSMLSNTFKPLKLKSANLTIEVEDKARSATLIGMRLDTTQIAPGKKLGIMLRFLPFRGKAIEKRVEFAFPENLPDGLYRVTMTSARGYNRWASRYRPHRQLARSVDDLFEISKQMAVIDDDAIYFMMQLPSSGLAVGRQELPQLPGSRAAIISSPNNNLTSPFVDWVEKKVSLGFVPSAETTFSIAVKRDLKK